MSIIPVSSEKRKAAENRSPGERSITIHKLFNLFKAAKYMYITVTVVNDYIFSRHY